MSDERLRRLERRYQESGDFESGVAYLHGLLQVLASPEMVAAAYDALRVEYPAPYTNLDTESTLIRAHFYLDRPSRELCDENQDVLCHYSKPLIWDHIRGYPPGTSQAWIDAISHELYRKGLVKQLPQWYDDQRRASLNVNQVLSSPESFQNLTEPHYAIALFHNRSEHHRFNGFLRVIWNEVRVGDIDQDYGSYHGGLSSYKTRFDCFVEDEPLIRDYQGPRVALGNIPGRASGGRRSISTSSTQRVNLDVGISKALDTVCDLARGIYYADTIQEEYQYSGLQTYHPV